MPNWAERQAEKLPLTKTDGGPGVDLYGKEVPSSILVFGASGHIGGPLAHHVREISPGTRLRLASSSPAKAEELRGEFPEAEVAIADLLDVTTLVPALDGIEGAFVITPDMLPARQSMINFIAAAQKVGSLKHVIRFQGENLEVKKTEHVPAIMRDEQGTTMSHIWAREIFEFVGDYIPVSFLAAYAWFHDSLIEYCASGIREGRVLAMPFDRRLTWVDTRDLGCAAANLLLSKDIRTIGYTAVVNDGETWCEFKDIASMMSQALGEQITYDSDPEAFKRRNIGALTAYFGDQGEAMMDFWLRYFEWEEQAANCVYTTGYLQDILGRKPVTLAEWITEHREVLLGEAPITLSRYWTEKSPERVKNPRSFTPTVVQTVGHPASVTAHKSLSPTLTRAPAAR